MKRFQTWLEKNDILASREKLKISVTSVEERYLQIRSGEMRYVRSSCLF